MAGVITHMVIAREINRRLPEGTIEDMGLFYLGNLAPDAIHAREGYIREYKKHTHFRVGISDMEFARADNIELFHRRISEFIQENKGCGEGLLDLYRGYVAHILTDELFILTLREEFSAAMIKLGITQINDLFFKYIVEDMNRNDMLLVRDYEGSEEIRKSMEAVDIYPIPGYLSEEEMRISRDWLVQQHYYTKHDYLMPRYITHLAMLDFIQMAADNIVTRLSDDESFPRMF